MDRMAGLLFKAKLGANNGQDGRMAGFTGKVVFKLSWKLKKDRITGWQDLQDGLFKTKQGTKMDRITRFTG